MPIFLDIRKHKKLRRCLHTTEVAGSNPASPTFVSLSLQVKRKCKEGSGHTLGLFYTSPITATLIYVGRRRAGARFGGWVGALRDGGFGIGRVTGSSGVRVTVAPWCATSREAPWSKV